MNSIATAALWSWNISFPVTAALMICAAIYIRGWRAGRRLLHDQNDASRLIAFLAGLAVIFVALESPLDSFDGVYLAAHMTQHFLLMMVAPPLILLARPVVPLLRGLPKPVAKEALGPFLTWRPLRRFFEWLASPLVAWVVFAASTVGWHVPYCYELALHSRFWHGAQHASFFWTGILFWWLVVEPGPGKSKWPRWAAIPYLLASDLLNTAISAAFVFSGRILYPSYAAVHVSKAAALSDQTLAGLIMWIPGEMIYLVPAFFLTMRVVVGSKRQQGYGIRPVRIQSARPRRDLTFALARWRRPLQVAMLLVAAAVIADGWWGPQVTPLNLAGVLPWIHWRGLSILALLLAGNMFCMACPFTLVRDVARKILPAGLRWPRYLRNKWIPFGLLFLYLWAYEAFALWDSPWFTAWIIAGYFAAAVLIDGLFRGASFCKYVCPIGQFHFVSSLVSPKEVGVRRPQVCKSCETHDCIRGNERQRGCELYLFQPKKSSNLDCTFCLDCVKACPEGNVGLLSIAPASTLTSDPYRSSLGRLSKRTDMMALVLLFVFGAFVNAAGMVAPVMAWEHGWHARLGVHAMPLIVGAFVASGVLLIPAILVAAAAGFNRLAQPQGNVRDMVRRFALALAPMGFGMWAGHLLYHLATGWAAALPAVERAVAGTASAVVMPLIPAWLTPLQIVMLDAGLLLSFWAVWKIAADVSAPKRSAIVLMMPWLGIALALYGAGLWILFQPMQMRGMVH